MTDRPLPTKKPGCTCEPNIAFMPSADADVVRWRRSHTCCNPIERIGKSGTFHSDPEWESYDVAGRLVVVEVMGVTRSAFEDVVQRATDLRERLLDRDAERVLFAFHLVHEAPT